jgi:hypothetical protein
MSTVAYEHADSASSSTHPQLMGGDEEPGGPDKYDPDTPGLMVLKDQGVGPHHPGLHSQKCRRSTPLLSTPPMATDM